MDINDKAHEAVVKFLNHRDYYLVREYNYFDIVCVDANNNAIVFVNVYVQENLNDPEIDRDQIEHDMVMELLDLPELTDMPVRFDTVTIIAMGDRALIKHHIDALGKPEGERNADGC